jgi:hypothetical protein
MGYYFRKFYLGRYYRQRHHMGYYHRPNNTRRINGCQHLGRYNG